MALWGHASVCQEQFYNNISVLQIAPEWHKSCWTFFNSLRHYVPQNAPAHDRRMSNREQRFHSHGILTRVSRRMPDCAKFKHAGFGVSRGKGPDSVLLKVAAGTETVTATVPLGQTEMVQVGGQVIVWVKPQPLEEGAHLIIDSLVLDTGSEDPVVPRTFSAQ